MIEKHKCTNLIVAAKREDFFEFFRKALSSIDNALNANEILEELENGDIDGFDAVDELESLMFNDTDALKYFTANGISAQPSMTIVIRDTIVHIGKFNELVRDLVNSGLYLEIEDVEKVKYWTNKIISELAYVMWFEFLIGKHIEALETNDEWIDEIVGMYISTYQIELPGLCEKIKSIKEQYPFRLSIFEDYPEYLNDFEKVMGPDMGALLEWKGLTIEHVKMVISGELTPEALQLLAQQEADYEGDANNMNVF